MFKAKLIAVTTPVVEGIEDAKELIAFCARVSNPSNQMNMDTADKLLNYLVKHKHWSPLEMCNAVVEVDSPRDIARQLLRHRSFSFQEFCVAGNTKITLELECGASKKLTIEKLYARQNSPYKSRCSNLVRHYDEVSKTFVKAKIKEVFDTGVKPCLKMTLEGTSTVKGRTITATPEHKFLTLQGWKMLGEIEQGDFIATNGVALYKNKDWLERAKIISIETKTGVQGIADIAQVSYHTIRKWLKIHSLQFTKLEAASYRKIWNKGLSNNLQPAYGKPHSDESREKQRGVVNRGTSSNLYVDGRWCKDNLPFRQKVTKWGRGHLMTLLKEQGYKCAITGVDIDMKTGEIDHINPVYAFPEKAFARANIQAVSKEAHRKKTMKEVADSMLTISYKPVHTIEDVGMLQTYDMEIDAPSHNYIANGIVSHNSQRYADVTTLENAFCLRDLRMQDVKNRQNSIESDDKHLAEWWEERQEHILNTTKAVYAEAIELGIAKEVARVILPEGLTMSKLYVNGTIRSWAHYLEVRMEQGVTQAEHVELATLIAEQINKVFKLT